MNRWWGSKADSDNQAAERNSRAARRVIQTLPQLPDSSDEDAEYNDCDTSLLFSNVDGADDNLSDDMNAAELARQRALPVEDSNFEDDPESWKKEVKVKLASVFG